MATLAEINAVAIRDFGGVGKYPNVAPAPEAKSFVNFAIANQTKPIKEIIYNYHGIFPETQVLETLKDFTANPDRSSSAARQDFASLAEGVRQANESLKTVKPQMNNTANSPNVFSLGIPAIVVIAGIIGLFILGRRN